MNDTEFIEKESWAFSCQLLELLYKLRQKNIPKIQLCINTKPPISYSSPYQIHPAKVFRHPVILSGPAMPFSSRP